MMQARFIAPHQLEADAVVPQCLDNQFVSDRIYRYMVAAGVNYDDAHVHDLRETDTRNEFVRSLVYSSQVIVNRAYLANNANIYKYFAPGSMDLAATAALVGQRAIVPFLFRESSLVEDKRYDVRSEGDKAIVALIDTLGEHPACLRLAADDAANDKATRLVELNFRNYLTRFRLYDDDQRNAAAAELFADPAVLHDGEGWRLFGEQLRAVADFAYGYDRAVPRNEVYRRFVMAPDSNVALGHFRAPGRDNPFIFEIKKLIDLAYNTTLPDLLNRFTFTPATLPSRAALQDQLTLAAAQDDWVRCLPGPEILDWIRRHFHARMNRAMTLPLLSRLTLTDVLEVRGFDEWAAFRDMQTDVLEHPLELPEKLPAFSAAFDAFQTALSRWYERKYQAVETHERYTSFVTFLLQIGGRYICATCVPPGEHHLHVAADTLMEKAVEAIPKRLKGVVAKLMIGAYDVDRHRLDRERSYTIELRRSSQELLEDEIRDLAQRLTDRRGDARVNLGHLADQGRHDEDA